MAYVCPVDSSNCEVLSVLPAIPELALVSVSGFLPCNECRLVEKQVHELSGVKLGKTERRLLLLAPQPGEPFSLVGADSDTPAAKEAHRRARRNLCGRGLLELSWERDRVMYYVRISNRYMKDWNRDSRRVHFTSRGVVLQTVRLTPLGAAVVGVLGGALESKTPIRWPLHQGEILRRCRLSTESLCGRFRINLDKGVEWRKKDLEFARQMIGFAGMGGNASAMRKYVESAAGVSESLMLAEEARSCISG